MHDHVIHEPLTVTIELLDALQLGIIVVYTMVKVCGYILGATQTLGHGLVKCGPLICVTVKHLSDLCQLHHCTA
jgi:hypothetical protein